MASLTDAKRLVVKIGSALLVDRSTGVLRRDWLISIAEDVAWLKRRGTDVILVSSGSIALATRLGATPDPEAPLPEGDTPDDTMAYRHRRPA